MASKYLTLGNGELWFGRFVPGTQESEGERYIGHSTAFGLSVSSENLEHQGSDRGVKKVDASTLLSVSRTGSFVTDTISPDNMAMALMGTSAILSVVGATTTDEPIANVKLGLAYQLGVSDDMPAGVVNLDIHTAATTDPVAAAKNVIVKVGATAMVEGEDYTVDMAQGYIIPLAGGDIVDGDDLTVSYKTKTSTRDVIVSGNTEVEGVLRYRAYNAEGVNINYFMPYVKLTVDGEVTLKSGDQWAEIPFNVQVLEKEGLEGIYGNGIAL